MKTLKSMALGLILLALGGVANATDTEAGKASKNYAINTYVDAMTRGKLNGLNDVLSTNAEFSMLRGKQVLNFSKKQMMEYFETTKNVEQNCDIRTQVVESNTDMAIVKVDMNFSTFVRSNYVTLIHIGDSWKINNVYSVFK